MTNTIQAGLWLSLGLWGGCVFGPALASEPQYLHIIDEAMVFEVKRPDGNRYLIRREMTPCALNAGVLQPLIPLPGVHPVTEIEVLHALNDADALVVDMRVPSDRIKGTIPGSISMEFTTVADRLDELGCQSKAGQWDCSQAKKVYAFCNGPVCTQSPVAIRAMVRNGYPAHKIYYYRGGMLDWQALGLTVLKDDF